ncbi:transcriptional regulator, IclR family protein [Novosphingobium sp. Rr 2-17]|uniref:IclR family transcriptional regulator n=1 Tax=Novosphingobium sp. Rr 2-17 TaxID=555793 RepID=UPI000269A89A|nr:IclR family transcriptional regulator C-terminal domain-containing protein [Novosphingobium sp. Rr 2-17]EIZ77227.1 transcriptional regulator, IclR family protein [Novosphingobium sp. Rr 2-17]
MSDEIKSAARVLDMLELFSTRCGGLTLSEVARGLELPKSSTLGLLRTLHKRGYLVRENEDDTYRLNDMIRRDGFARHGRILRVAPPVMQALAANSGETVLLGMPDAPGLVRLLAKEASPSDIRYDIELPRKVPAFCTALGRVLLARLEPKAVEAALDAVPRAAMTASTRVERGAVLDAIDAARETGFSVCEDEFAVGGTGVAAVIPLGPGQPLAALGLACISQRYRQDPGRLQSQLSGAINQIAEAMAGQGNA